MITIDRKQLVEPLSKAVKAADQRGVMPILTCVLVNLHDGVMTITGTDLDVAQTATINCDGENWAGCLPAGKLLGAVKSMATDTIQIKPGKNRAEISAGRSRIRLPVLPAEDFPAPERPQGEPAEMSAQELRDAFIAVKAAMGKKDARHYLNGAHLVSKEGRMQVVATDGHRMAYAEAASPAECSLILPRDSVIMLADLLATGERVTVVADEKSFRAEVGALTFQTRLLDARYPDWERVIPKTTGVVACGSGDLVQALNRAAIVTQGEIERVLLNISEQGIALQAEGGDGGKLDDAIEAQGNGSVEIFCNLFYVIDAIQTANSESVEVLFSGPEGALQIRPAGREDRFSVVMPHRL